MSESAVGVFLCFKKFRNSDFYDGFVRCKGYKQPISFKKSCIVWLESSYPDENEKALIFLDGIHFEEFKKDDIRPRASQARFATLEEIDIYNASS